MEWVVNGRFRGKVQTGVQRVAAAYLARIRSPHVVVEPEVPSNGLKGHWWEQVALPRKGGDRPLWSPCNTGPLLVSNQIVTIHDAVTFDHPEWFSRSFVSVYRMLLPKLAQRCRKIVTVSHFSRDRLALHLGVPKKAIDVIWNGVDSHFTPASDEAIAQARKAIGLEDAPYFLTLSTLEPRKNLKLVLNAWARARGRLPKHCKLVIVGPKGDSQIFRDTNLDGVGSDVITSGFLPDEILVGLLSGAQAVLYPSLYEGFGLPVVEAMACGAPVITCALASLPEVAGEAAIYVDPIQPDEMAEQMVRLSQSAQLRGDLAEEGKAQAALFSWDNAAREMDSILAAAA
jgi:glycosyltransferase involved in cell wall biosynthesis